MKQIIQYSFYPVLVFGFTWLAFYLIQFIPSKELLWLPVFILPPLITLIILSEKLLPYNKQWSINLGDFTTDLFQTFITLPFAIQACKFALPFLLIVPHNWLIDTFNINLIDAEINTFLLFSIALLLSEFCYYWLHRLSHTVPLLWRFHFIHHVTKRVYWANSGRFHLIDAILGSAAYLLPLVLFGFPQEIVALVLIFSGVTGFLEHVNINFKAGFLNYLFNTAELHRWHHSEKEDESNNNFGKALIIWDILFGTFLWHRKRQVADVGVQNQKDIIGLKEQMIQPFENQ